MEKIEYENVMNEIMNSNPSMIKKSKDEYLFGDIMVHFCQKYAVVKGKTPLSVALTLFNNYENGIYGIRVGGKRECTSPYSCAVDDDYNMFLIEFGKPSSNIEELLSQLSNQKMELKNRNDIDKYVEEYHIDTVEGLIVYFYEMEKYYYKIENNQIHNCVEIMDNVKKIKFIQK